MKNLLQLCLLTLFVSVSAAQTTNLGALAEIETVRVVPSGDQMKIEVRLTGAVHPRVMMAVHPDRLVLELPNTLTEARQQHIVVNQAGVKDLRIGLTSANPMVTRVVVDLDCARPYGLAMVGNTIALTVLPPSPEQRTNALDGITVTAVPAMTRVASKRLQIGFKVKYVAEGVVYLAGGRSAGLEEGMTLTVTESKKGASRSFSATEANATVAQLRVISVAETSAVTDVHDAKRNVKPGDWAYLSADETEMVMERRGSGRKRGQAWLTSSSSGGQGFQASAPHVPEEQIVRVRGRIGFDYSGITGSTGSSTSLGLIARSDITHIAGSHWNLEGYWRGRLTRQSRTEENSLQNMLNKTYTMQMYYDNPESKWVAGFGRLYLPWASSLDTIDGGYVGRRLANGMTAGVFAGSTPDPTSWHYNPNQRIAGSFVNFEGGSGNSFRYTNTTGIAISTRKWRLDRPFVFLENGIFYRNSIAVYHTLIADAPQGLTTDGISPGAGISRSYLTLRVQPYERLSFDFYHNYFRDVPTAATALIGTGLVDKLLYQGVSLGVRVEPLRHYWVYTTLGESDKTGDTRRALNQMYGFTVDEIARTGVRADVHYSKFDSSFGRGDYALLTLSRHLGDRMMWDAQIGQQRLVSPFTVNTNSRFVDTSFDMNLWGKSFLQSGYTWVRGDQMNYNQWYMSLGYRFDEKPGTK